MDSWERRFLISCIAKSILEGCGTKGERQCRIVFRQGVGVREVRIDRLPIPSGSRALSWEPWLRTIPTGTDPKQASKQATTPAALGSSSTPLAIIRAHLAFMSESSSRGEGDDGRLLAHRLLVDVH
ncbi:hypothetical protein HZH68_002416 [Vespula germanica]|uniref:Uncharacterized protein n=1 Tax=Vespula germanica TaxID=30212 RepID=A0A834NM98_VESGE|nr:hypothetical protein HZH68_002416 [Vespula germanica]